MPHHFTKIGKQIWNIIPNIGEITRNTTSHVVEILASFNDATRGRKKMNWTAKHVAGKFWYRRKKRTRGWKSTLAFEKNICAPPNQIGNFYIMSTNQGCGSGSWKQSIFSGSRSAKILPLPFPYRLFDLESNLAKKFCPFPNVDLSGEVTL